MTPPGAVDCHAHVMRRGIPMTGDRHSEPTRDIGAEEFLAVLDLHGVTSGVLTAPSFYGADNALLLNALSHAPEQLRGTVILDPEQEPVLDDLERQGVRGVRLNWLRRTTLPDAGSVSYQRLFAAMRERGWHIELFLEGDRLHEVLPHLLASGARVVLDHFGCPEPTMGVVSAGFFTVLAAVRDGNTWVKLSAPYRLYGANPRPYVNALLEAGGPERLVWGSDWPWIGHEGLFNYQDCLEWLTHWVPDEATRRTILVDTPAELFGFARA